MEFPTITSIDALFPSKHRAGPTSCLTLSALGPTAGRGSMKMLPTFQDLLFLLLFKFLFAMDHF